MKKILTFPAKGNVLTVHKDIVLAFSKGCNKIQCVNKNTGQFSVIESRSPIVNVTANYQKIFIFQKKIIEGFSIENFSKELTYVVSNIEIFLDLPNGTRMFLRRDKLFIYQKHPLPIVVKIRGYQQYNNFLIIFFMNKVELYENSTDLIFSKPTEDFKKSFQTVISEDLPMSVYNNKLYFLTADRILGPDLNVYLDDINRANKNKVIGKTLSGKFFTKFECIENEFILLDNSCNLYISSRSLQEIQLITKAIDFVYDRINQWLIITNGKKIDVYKKPDHKVSTFELIEENIVYSEAEDEFDSSNDDLQMF